MLRKLAFLVLLFAGAASADTVLIYFTTLPSTQMSSTYVVTSGDYVGDVGATIDGISTELMCDDKTDTTNVPSNEVYDFSTLTGSNPLAHVKYTSNETFNGTVYTDTQLYEAASILLVNFSELTNPSAQTITDYNYAIWNLFNPTGVPESGNPPSSTNGSTALQNSALAAVTAGTSTSDYSRLVIYTPNYATGGTGQEFLGIGTPTPEPNAAPLVGGMLLCGLLLARRRGRA